MNQSDYTVTKVILDKKNRVEVHYKLKYEESKQLKTKAMTCKTNSVAHPDLIVQMENLMKYVQKIYGFADIESVIPNNISIGGGKVKTAVISSKFKCLCGKVVALNTPALQLDGESAYDFQDDLRETVEAIEAEAFEFLENGKEAQATIPFEEEGGEDPKEDTPEEAPAEGVIKGIGKPEPVDA